jgi:hypothetical protein
VSCHHINQPHSFSDHINLFIPNNLIKISQLSRTIAIAISSHDGLPQSQPASDLKPDLTDQN